MAEVDDIVLEWSVLPETVEHAAGASETVLKSAGEAQDITRDAGESPSEE
jgi:hypothetical protein